jgi:hypothetical protein
MALRAGNCTVPQNLDTNNIAVAEDVVSGKVAQQAASTSPMRGILHAVLSMTDGPWSLLEGLLHHPECTLVTHASP